MPGVDFETVVVGSPATLPRSGVGDGILASRASHTTRDIVTRQNGTRGPPLWHSRETMDEHYAHTGEEATGTQYIHPIARFPSIIVIGGQSIISTTLTPAVSLGPRPPIEPSFRSVPASALGRREGPSPDDPARRRAMGRILGVCLCAGRRVPRRKRGALCTFEVTEPSRRSADVLRFLARTMPKFEFRRFGIGRNHITKFNYLIFHDGLRPARGVNFRPASPS